MGGVVRYTLADIHGFRATQGNNFTGLTGSTTLYYNGITIISGYPETFKAKKCRYF